MISKNLGVEYGDKIILKPLDASIDGITAVEIDLQNNTINFYGLNGLVTARIRKIKKSYFSKKYVLYYERCSLIRKFKIPSSSSGRKIVFEYEVYPMWLNLVLLGSVTNFRNTYFLS